MQTAGLRVLSIVSMHHAIKISKNGREVNFKKTLAAISVISVIVLAFQCYDFLARLIATPLPKITMSKGEDSLIIVALSLCKWFICNSIV